jgi:hypothetical protein
MRFNTWTMLRSSLDSARDGSERVEESSVGEVAATENVVAVEMAVIAIPTPMAAARKSLRIPHLDRHVVADV